VSDYLQQCNPRSSSLLAPIYIIIVFCRMDYRNLDLQAYTNFRRLPLTRGDPRIIYLDGESSICDI